MPQHQEPRDLRYGFTDISLMTPIHAPSPRQSFVIIKEMIWCFPLWGDMTNTDARSDATGTVYFLSTVPPSTRRSTRACYSFSPQAESCSRSFLHCTCTSTCDDLHRTLLRPTVPVPTGRAVVALRRSTSCTYCIQKRQVPQVFDYVRNGTYRYAFTTYRSTTS